MRSRISIKGCTYTAPGAQKHIDKRRRYGRRTDGRSDGWTNRRTDGWTTWKGSQRDGKTLIECFITFRNGDKKITFLHVRCESTMEHTIVASSVEQGSAIRRQQGNDWFLFFIWQWQTWALLPCLWDIFDGGIKRQQATHTIMVMQWLCLRFYQRQSMASNCHGNGLHSLIHCLPLFSL